MDRNIKDGTQVRYFYKICPVDAMEIKPKGGLYRQIVIFAE
jgi:hypothetical protein